MSKEVETEAPAQLKVPPREAPKVEAPASAFPVVIRRVDASVRAAASAAQETSELLGKKLPANDPIQLALLAASNPKNIQSVRINVESG